MSDKQILIQQAKDIFAKIDKIPTTFEPQGTLWGIDRDWAFDVIDETQIDENDKPVESSVKELKDIIDTITEYLDVHRKEVKELTFLQYTTPKSVHAIMDAIGTKGVLNSEFGLSIIRDTELSLKKKDWLVKQGERLYVITSDEYLEYQEFLK